MEFKRCVEPTLFDVNATLYSISFAETMTELFILISKEVITILIYVARTYAYTIIFLFIVPWPSPRNASVAEFCVPQPFSLAQK